MFFIFYFHSTKEEVEDDRDNNDSNQNMNFIKTETKEEQINRDDGNYKSVHIDNKKKDNISHNPIIFIVGYIVKLFNYHNKNIQEDAPINQWK